jgi:hypothetical protein
MISASPVIGSEPVKIGIKRYFFVAMATLILLTVFVGFAPSFYLRSSFHPDHELSVVLHIHGILFSAWIVLLLVQTVLIAKGSRRLHQRLGWVTVGVAAAMLLLVLLATKDQIRGIPPEDAAGALALNMLGSILFGIPVVAAVYNRKRPDWHKRLMLGATFGLLGAPILRLLFLSTNLEFQSAANVAAVLTNLFFLPCFAYDLVTRGRIHRAYIYVLALFIVSQVVLMNVKTWGPWLAFARSVQHLLN